MTNLKQRFTNKPNANNVISDILSGKKGRPILYRGSGNYMKTYDYTNIILKYLIDNNYEYELGNDAKRGGKAGNFIILKSKPNI